jgi:hypothetical protein
VTELTLLQFANLSASITAGIPLFTSQRKRFQQVPDTLNGKQNDFVCLCQP